MSKKRSPAHLKAQKLGKERDGYTCQVCGSQAKVQGHHIIDVQFNGAANNDNIISLCQKHHTKVHQGKLVIKKF